MIRFRVLLFVAALGLATAVSAKSLVLTGVGTTGFGGTGEGITVTVELNSEDFVFVPVANDAFRLFDAIRDVPIVVDREVSGPLLNVAPVAEFTALELTGTGSRDQISLRSISGGTARTLASFSCQTDDCFDGAGGPFDSIALLDLFEEAVTDTSRWSVSTALSSVTTNGSGFSFGPLEWSVLNPDAAEIARITPTFDAMYSIGATTQLIEGDQSLRVGGFTGSASFPEGRPVMEFSLDDVPRGAEVVSARLEFDAFVSSGEPRIEVVGYAGDGVLAERDATVRGPVLAESPAMSISSYEPIELDPLYIESLLPGADHLGLRLRSLDSGEYLGFDALEEDFIGSTPPTLVVEYVFDGVEGDFNADGVLDAADYTVWRDNRGPAFNLADRADWTANYGTVVETPQTAVPEPVTLGLVLIGLLAAVNRGS